MNKHDCHESNAQKFWDWVKNRGGVAVWRSVNLSNPGKSWSTPAFTRFGDTGPQPANGDASYRASSIDADKLVPYPKPTWEADSKPERVVTSPDDIEVFTAKEHKRFHVAVRRGGQGFTLKVTDAGSRRIRREVAKAGEGAYYEFDYEAQDCVVMKSEVLGTLAEYAKKMGWN